jgi:molybdopterin converting factor small subunit
VKEIRVIFKSFLKDLVKNNYYDIAIKEAITVNELYQILFHKIPKLRNLAISNSQNLTELTIVVNNKVYSGNDLLPLNGNVEIYPPIAGG